MKILKTLAIFTAFIAVVVGGTLSTTACAETQAIEESKEVVKKTVVATEAQDDRKSEVRNVSGFTGVSVGGTIGSTIKVGSDFEVIVTAKDSIISDIITEVKGDKLVVRFKKDAWKNKPREYKRAKVSVSISLPALNDLNISGASQSKVSGINSNFMKIDISGASAVRIDGTANDLDLDISGASVMKGKNFFAQTAKVDLSGASSTTLNIASTLDVEASGASSVRYIGSPQVSKSTSGASSVSRVR